MVATDSLLVKDNQNVAPKAHILVQNPILKMSVFLQKTSILGSILTVLTSKKASVATKQRLKCVKRYQKRVQEA